MTNMTSNPWVGVNVGSSKRVESSTSFKFSWIRDDKGRNGLRLYLSNITELIPPDLKINGIALVIRKHEQTDDELFLVALNSSDYDIFHSLCKDLLNCSQLVTTELALCQAIINRLRHWQRFLKAGVTANMSEIQQMGLFAELAYINDRILNDENQELVLNAWNGPDSDKQDFSFQEFLIEVKSFITSKGPFVKISSLHQLYTDVKPLYLVAFGLTKSSSGRSVPDLIYNIHEKLAGKLDLLNSFHNKLIKYEYFEGITVGPFFQYSIDSVSGYQVIKTFPAITPSMVPDQITDVKYTVDLAKCETFKSIIPVL